MQDIIYRWDPTARGGADQPDTAAEALAILLKGNRDFARTLDPSQAVGGPPRIIYFDPSEVGLAPMPGSAPEQRPWAIVLGCADARAPIEIIFEQGCNELFVVRVAGNVLGVECLGSIDYAAEHFRDSVRLILVLGHSRCGAVAAAVEAFLHPANYLSMASTHPIRGVVDGIMVAVRAAAQALEERWGLEVSRHPNYRGALLEAAVPLNAALTAATVDAECRKGVGHGLEVYYGVYDLVTRLVVVPSADAELAGEISAVSHPPHGADEFSRLALSFAGNSAVRALLG